ncbi:MAG: membrane associated rhomboid family serine protease [Candidatus Azotimanducaceae bacterium]|jgi:membrane associated rhomboid family serine protease
MLRQWMGGFRRIAWLLVLLWGFHGVNYYFGMTFNELGILPRQWHGLYGVALWPLLHGNVSHLLMNTLPLLVLGLLVALRGNHVFVRSSVIIILLGGVGVWVLGRPAYHIGASGLAFGYFGFLIAVGVYEGRISSLAIATLVIFWYGGMIFGVVPQNNFVSWEGHLFGMLAGIFAARLLARRR